jgi:uncharacterized protein
MVITMNQVKSELRELLVGKAKEMINAEDVSHDFNHAMRVLYNAELIAGVEGGDLEVIVPAALFHDAVAYPKNDPRAIFSAKDSAESAEKILLSIHFYNQSKIPAVKHAILAHSFSSGVMPETIEAKIVQDADRLEATGAVSIMRTFASSGQMKRVFYNPEAPFVSSDKRQYSLDLFYDRLLKVGNLMNTYTARELARKRVDFLYAFLEQLKEEIEPKIMTNFQ